MIRVLIIFISIFSVVAQADEPTVQEYDFNVSAVTTGFGNPESASAHCHVYKKRSPDDKNVYLFGIDFYSDTLVFQAQLGRLEPKMSGEGFDGATYHYESPEDHTFIEMGFTNGGTVPTGYGKWEVDHHAIICRPPIS
jgi:hypothetical protein